MKLYYSQGSCSLASHIALEEAGAKFDAHRINLQQGDQHKPEFLKLNPKAKVPALQLDNGEVLTENPAIISYVADTHADSGLLPKPGDFARARSQEWLAWCASAVHPSFGPLFGSMRTKKPIDDALKAAVQANLDQYDKGLTGKTFVLGDRFSGADAYTLVFTLWAKLFGLKVGDNMLRSVKAVLQRPGVQRAVKTQELKIEL